LISPLARGPQHPVAQEVKKRKIAYIRMVHRSGENHFGQKAPVKRKIIFRLRNKYTCIIYLVVINDKTFCILSYTVSGNITGMEGAETFMTGALRETRRIVKYLLLTTRTWYFWDFKQVDVAGQPIGPIFKGLGVLDH
jgi:hypothetical protein